jgi:hypothetical protein
VKIDRLPKSNSYEALISIQDAWDHIDLYHQQADVYKFITKLSYIILLLSGMAISAVAILKHLIDQSPIGDNLSGSSITQYIILAISLLVTTIIGYANFMNPAQRWQQLRGDFFF